MIKRHYLVALLSVVGSQSGPCYRAGFTAMVSTVPALDISLVWAAMGLGYRSAYLTMKIFKCVLIAVNLTPFDDYRVVYSTSW